MTQSFTAYYAGINSCSFVFCSVSFIWRRQELPPKRWVIGPEGIFREQGKKAP